MDAEANEGAAEGAAKEGCDRRGKTSAVVRHITNFRRYATALPLAQCASALDFYFDKSVAPVSDGSPEVTERQWSNER